MTKDESVSIARLAEKVDEMASNMVTKDLLRAELATVTMALESHVEYTRSAAAAETKRLDAIRVVDATAVNVASERAVEQATVLANQVAVSAETLRGLVAITASTVAKNLENVSNQLIDRIAKLEQKQYENQGRSGLSAPLLMLLAGLGGGIIVYIIQLAMTVHP